MKLLVVSQYFYPEQFRINDVCFRLVEMGHDVTVLTGLPNYPMGEIFQGYKWDTLKKTSGYNHRLHSYEELVNGVRVIRSPLTPRKTGKTNLALNYLSFAWNASKIAKKIQENFDKIIVFQYSPVTMAIPAIIFKNASHKTTPLCLYCFDLWPESIVSAGLQNRGWIYNILKWISKKIYQKADHIFISSHQFEKYFNNKHGIYDNIHYLPIYAEDLFTEKNTDIPDQSSQKNAVNLIFAGNIGQMQSIETILYAAEIVEKQDLPIKFHIVGDGSALFECKKLAQKLKLNNTIFHGRHSLDDMPKYYQMADGFLVTMKKDDIISYTLPGKVQTYMASGKPILAAIDGETASVINLSGCGLVAPAEDSRSFAENILIFANSDEKERQRYGDLAKSYYNTHFSSEAFYNTLINLLSR